MKLHRRHLEDRVRQLFAIIPAVGIVGPRQVGKSTLVKELLFESAENVVYLDLERRADLALLAEPERYLRAVAKDAVVIIDEVQVIPEIFTALRPIIDEDRRPGNSYYLDQLRLRF